MGKVEVTQQEQTNKSAKFLIGIGVFFLLTQIFSFSIWPLFILVPGLPFLYFALNGRGGASAGLIFPGLMISGTGAILLYQSLTGHWESWAYIWTLYAVFLGIGLQFHGGRIRSRREVDTGKGFVRYGLLALAFLAFFFEFLIFGIGGILGSLWPLLLIGGGVYLLSRDEEHPLHDRIKNLTVTESKPKRTVTTSRYAGPSAEINPDLKRKIEEALAEKEGPVFEEQAEPKSV